MPNTPAMVGEGMTAVCPNEHLTEDEIAYVKSLLESFSRAEIVPERLMDVVTAVSGSSPAYVFMLIEAMADAAVAGGMPRQQAYKFAAQAVLGAAKMVLETGRHPGELKDMVDKRVEPDMALELAQGTHGTDAKLGLGLLDLIESAGRKGNRRRHATRTQAHPNATAHNLVVAVLL